MSTSLVRACRDVIGRGTWYWGPIPNMLVSQEEVMTGASPPTMPKRLASHLTPVSTVQPEGARVPSLSLCLKVHR